MSHQRGPAMSNAQAIPQHTPELLQHNTDLSPGRRPGGPDLLRKVRKPVKFLCRGTQAKNQERSQQGSSAEAPRSRTSRDREGLAGEQLSPCGSQKEIWDSMRLKRCSQKEHSPHLPLQHRPGNKGRDLFLWSQVGLRLFTCPQAVVHGRNPPALFSIQTPSPLPFPSSALPGSCTGGTDRWRSGNLLPVLRAL